MKATLHNCTVLPKRKSKKSKEKKRKAKKRKAKKRKEKQPFPWFWERLFLSKMYYTFSLPYFFTIAVFITKRNARVRTIPIGRTMYAF